MTARKRPRHPGAKATPEPRAGERHPSAQTTVVRLTDAAIDDLDALHRRDPQIVRAALAKMLILEKNPEAGEPLRGTLIGWRKIVVGDRDWRIVWSVTHDSSGTVIVDVAEVWAVGVRSDAEVYEEMRNRVAALDQGTPTAVALAEVVARFGKTAAAIDPTSEPTPEKLPDWLVTRLRQQVGLNDDQIASLSLEQAFDVWGEWSARPST